MKKKFPPRSFKKLFENIKILRRIFAHQFKHIVIEVFRSYFHVTRYMVTDDFAEQIFLHIRQIQTHA